MGRLRIAWTVTGRKGAQTLALTWRESGVAMPADTSRQGYGRTLIEGALTCGLRAKTALVFGEDGVRCHIEVPLPGAEPANPDPTADENWRPAFPRPARRRIGRGCAAGAPPVRAVR